MELMDRIGLDATYPGMTWDEEPVDVAVVVVQDGPAVWVEQEVVMERTRSFGLGFTKETMLLQAHCPSQLEVPLLASVRTLDGATEVVLEGTDGPPRGPRCGPSVRGADGAARGALGASDGAHPGRAAAVGAGSAVADLGVG